MTLHSIFSMALERSTALGASLAVHRQQICLSLLQLDLSALSSALVRNLWFGVMLISYFTSEYFFYFLHFFSHHSLRIISCDNLQSLFKQCRSVFSGQALVNVFLNERNMFLFTGDCNSCLIAEFREACYVVRDVLN